MITIVNPHPGFTFFSDLGSIFDGLIDKIIPNGIWPLVVQILATLIMVLIVYKLLYNPMKKMLAKRAEAVADSITNANKDKEAAKLALAEANETLSSSKIEAQSIIKEANLDGQKARDLLIRAGEQELKLKREKADNEIADARVAAEAAIQQEIITVAMAASKHILGREISEKDNEKLVEEFIKEVKN